MKVPISTLSRILDSLMLCPCGARRERWHLFIDERFLYLASLYRSNKHIITATRPALEWLSREAKEDTDFSILNGPMRSSLIAYF